MPDRNSEVTADSRSRNPKDPTVKDAVEDYLESLDSGGSQSTMSYPLSDFVEWCESTIGVDRVGELDAYHLRDYGQDLKSRKAAGDLKASTARTYFDYIRAFLGFCVRSRYLETNPADTHIATEFLPEDKGDRRAQFWTEDQRDMLLSYANKRVQMALEGSIDVPREASLS